MVGHDHKGVQLVVAECDPATDRVRHEAGEGFLTQVERSAASGIQVTIHPCERA